jgi:hypothetical protein
MSQEIIVRDLAQFDLVLHLDNDGFSKLQA